MRAAFAAAGLLTLVLVGCGAPVTSQAPSPASPTGSGAPLPTPPPSANPSPSSLATPAHTAESSPTSNPRPSFVTSGIEPGKIWASIAWTKLPANSPLSSIRGLVHWRGGYVAYGDAGLWTSTDGRLWKPSSDVPGNMTAVAETSIGLVALVFGFADCPVIPRPCYPSAAGTVEAWTTTDGLSWVDRGLAIGVSGLQLAGVGGSPLGAVASTTDSNKPGVAYSADGVTWKAVVVPSVSSAFWCQDPEFGMGLFTMICPAAQPTALGDLPSQPVFSADGIHWAAGTAPMTTDRPAGMDRVLVGRSGLMATGYVPGEGGAAQWWRSDNGMTWQMLNGYSPVGSFTSRAIPGGTYPNGTLAADGTRIVALGLDAQVASLSGETWSSWDGKSWSKLASHGAPVAGPMDEIVFPTGILAGDWWGTAG